MRYVTTLQSTNVSTKDNIADDLTRHKGFDSLHTASRWCNGPDFLYNCLENHEIIRPGKNKKLYVWQKHKMDF